MLFKKQRVFSNNLRYLFGKHMLNTWLPIECINTIKKLVRV